MLGLDTREAARDGGHELTALSRSGLDISDQDAVRSAIAASTPDAVINCAAYTDVDGAESDPEAAYRVNGTAAGVLAAAAASAGAWLIHVSTDYVFDGSKRTPYLESDPTGPQSAYGASKLAGEAAIAHAAPKSHTIVRSSWLFGAGGHCFPATMLRLAGERDELTVVDDQVGCPTFTGHLAGALIELATAPERPLGVAHIAAAGECSWYDFAVETLRRADAATEIRRGSTAQLGRPAPRPAYSVLRTERGDSVPRLPHWHEGLSEYLELTVAAR